MENSETSMIKLTFFTLKQSYATVKIQLRLIKEFSPIFFARLTLQLISFDIFELSAQLTGRKKKSYIAGDN